MGGPLDRLRHHVSGAIERGDTAAIVGVEHPTFAALPKGWRIIASRRSDAGSIRLWVILCEKDDDRKPDTQYVTWKADAEEGGCYWGHYQDDRIKATVDYNTR